MLPLRVTPTLIVDALRAHWKPLLLPILLVPIVAVGAASVVKPKLKASALILVQAEMAPDPVMRDYVTEVKINRMIPAIASLVRSNQTLERVLRRLGEIQEGSDAQDIAWRVGSFRGQIDVYGEGAGLVRISVVGRWPGRVYEGLSYLSEELIAELVSPQTRALAETVTFLEAQLERVQQELADAEGRIRALKETAMDLLPEVHKLNLETYAKLSGTLIAAEADLVEAEERLEAYNEQLDNRPIATSGGVRASEALVRARATLRKLRATYTSAHPEVQAASAVVAQLERRHASQREAAAAKPKPQPQPRRGAGPKDFQELERDTHALREKVDFLGKRADELLASIQSRARRESDLSSLTRTRDVKSKVYASLLERYEDARVSHSLARSQAETKVRVVEAPTAPDVAPQYSKLIMLIAGLIGGLLLGLSAVVVLELLDRTVRLPEEVEPLSGVPVIAALPHLGRVA